MSAYGTNYTGWFDGWQNARQRRAIEGLEGHIGALSSSLYRQRREAAQLRSQLSQLHGSLEQRVQQLTRSLEALVELSDVRQILAMYDAPARVRHWARESITDLASREKDFRDQPPPPDVPGYWLGPAVSALVALVRGRGAAEAVALAEERDRQRTALLLVTGLAVAGRPELAEPWLGEALGQFVAGIPVTVAQRTLWTEMAVGSFGAPGTVVLRKRLTSLVETLTADQAAEESRAWSVLVDQLPTGSIRVPGIAKQEVTLHERLKAGGRLAALRSLCIPTTLTTAGGDPDQDALTEVVHALVDEGMPEEAPLLRRTVELRAAIAGGPQSAPPNWDAEAGEPCALLRADAANGAAPERSRVAAYVGRHWLIAEATRLAEAASRVDLPAVTVAAAGDKIRVGPGGPDSWDLARVRTAIQERPVVDTRAGRVAGGLMIAGGVVGALLTALVPALAVLTVLAGAVLLTVGIVQWRREQIARTERAAQKDAEIRRIELQISQTAGQLTDLQRQAEESTARATSDLAAIRDRLAA